jgi:peptidoglycan/LPS O-acetylase OafA/YrhL
MPSLDGLRAISIALVLLGHLRGTRNFPLYKRVIGDTAHLGVVVFFVISGFLITTLLMHEYQLHGTISLKLFYARRAIRIFPACYGYLAVLGLLCAFGLVHLTAADFWHGITYTVNFAPYRSWLVGHLWSISVEEQFYLLWPFAFLAMGMRKGGWAAFSLLFIGILGRVVNRLLLVGTPLHDLEMFPMVADSLAMGCLLALLRERLEQKAWYLRLFHPAWSLLILALALVLNRLSDYTVIEVLGTSVINLCLAILIHRSVYVAKSPIGAFLNWRPLAFVGTLSYSLYLWQQPFLNRSSTDWVNAFPQNIVFAIAAALASYYLLETPFLSLRNKLRAKAD